MNALLQIGLSNAVFCGMMAALLLPLARWLRRPALTHALSVLILLKLFTPPLFNVSVLWNSAEDSSAGSVTHSAASSAAGSLRDSTASRQMTFASAAPSGGASMSSPVPAEVSDDSVQALGDDDAAIEPYVSAKHVSSIPAPAAAAASTWRTRIWKATSEHWRIWLLAAWIASAVVLGALALARIIRLGLALRRATVHRGDIAREVEILSDRLGIRRIPRVRFIAGSAPPMLVALGCRPELVIPTGLWDRLEHAQRQTLLLHELAHLRRGDHWVRYVELLATCIYWWHPAMWLARSALREAEEQCCDAWVVWAMPDSSRTYMTTILDAIDFLSTRALPHLAAAPVLASGMGQFHNLQRRLAMVRERTVQRRLGGHGLAAVALVAAIALPIGAKLARGDERAAATATTAETAAAQTSQASAPRAEATRSAQEAVVAANAHEVTGAPPSASADTLAPPDTDLRDPDRGHAAQVQEMARLEAELEAARKNVERFRHQLDVMKSQSRGQRLDDPAGDSSGAVGAGQPAAPSSAAPATAAPAIGGSRDDYRDAVSARSNNRRASLGHILFRYQDAGADGEVLAYDRASKRLMWKLKAPLNADSVIQCYDNETLLIKSADGYTRLVNAEDGQVTRAWAPGVEAPAAAADWSVNPFGQTNDAGPNRSQMPLLEMTRVRSPNTQDQEKRLERIEESLRRLTEAVDRLTRERKDQRGAPAPSGGN